MCQEVVSVEAHDAISTAGSTMVSTKLRSLPVVNHSVEVVSMKPTPTGPRLRAPAPEAGPAHADAIEALIDEIGAQSFPASDPPAWGVVSARLDEAAMASRHDDRRGLIRGASDAGTAGRDQS
jgi:hypothetical protein